MPNNDQPTLSAEQMAEVRAAVKRFDHLGEGNTAVLYVFNEDIGGALTYFKNLTARETEKYRVIALDLATILNAAPALLALADECERLREHAEIARSRVLLMNQGCDDLSLQDEAMGFLEQALGPLPGDLAPT